MFLTVEQVAERLQVSAQTVWRMLRTNELTGVKLRGQWRVTEADLAAYLNTLTVKETN